MVDSKEYMTLPEENGSINIAEDVIAAIAGDLIDSYVTQAAIKGIAIDSLAINIKQTGHSLQDWG